MTSHHVTAMSRASSSSLKGKIKRNSKKRNIKSRKIDKRERKMLVSKRSITTSEYLICDREWEQKLKEKEK